MPRKWSGGGVAVAWTTLLAAGCGDPAPDNRMSEAEPAAAWPAPLPELAGRTVLSGCRQGQCASLRVASVERAGSVPQGELRRLVARRGFSRYEFDAEPPSAFDESVAIEWEPGDQSLYAFCSIERPSYAFPDEDGKLILHRIDLYDLAGYQTASATMYMRICHGSDGLPEPGPALAELGYRPGTPNEQVEVASPDEIVRF